MFTREILNKDNSWKKKNKEYPNEDYLDAYKEITYEGQSNIPTRRVLAFRKVNLSSILGTTYHDLSGLTQK